MERNCMLLNEQIERIYFLLFRSAFPCKIFVTSGKTILVRSIMFCVNQTECMLFHSAHGWAIKISGGKHHSGFINSSARKTGVHFSKSAVSRWWKQPIIRTLCVKGEEGRGVRARARVWILKRRLLRGRIVGEITIYDGQAMFRAPSSALRARIYAYTHTYAPTITNCQN